MEGRADITIELRGLRVQARIGVSDEELEVERPLVIDIDVAPSRVGATESDELAGTVDYGLVATRAAEVATGSPHRTLERLAARIAEALAGIDGCDAVSVRVAKPDPPTRHRVDEAAVRVSRRSR